MLQKWLAAKEVMGIEGFFVVLVLVLVELFKHIMAHPSFSGMIADKDAVRVHAGDQREESASSGTCRLC